MRRCIIADYEYDCLQNWEEAFGSDVQIDYSIICQVNDSYIVEVREGHYPMFLDAINHEGD